MDFSRFLLLIFLSSFIKQMKMDILSSLENLQMEFDKFMRNQFSVFQEPTIANIYIEIGQKGGIETFPVNPLEIAKDFSNKLANEFRKKMESLKRAVDFAEEEATKYQYDPHIKPEEVQYINSKDLPENSELLVDHPLFKTRVIANQSSVHIPTEIYKEGIIVLNALKWTGNLDNIWKKNIEIDQDLLWQYFASQTSLFRTYPDSFILNTLKWTQKLNNIFIRASNNLRYQYFASFTGIVLQYPGMRWRKKGTDMFDVRRRQWYVQGASSPKDVMVLIDTSGSMHGIAIKLTKSAVEKLIDTMGENDYIAVTHFPPGKNQAMQLIKDYPFIQTKPCFATFVQASKRNKDRLFKQIFQLRAQGIANLDTALEFAINEFHKFDNRTEKGNEGANCNRLIVVFTDSGDEYDKEKIRSLMNRSNTTKNLRIFIYYVGEEITPIDVLENRTCEYRGYFGHIHAMGAVSNIIDKYSKTVHYHTIHRENQMEDNEFRIDLVSVNEDGFHNPEDFPPMDVSTALGHTMVFNEETYYVWHNIYLDSLGLGLMTSLTMPVYNRSGNGSFLGLLGTDMTVAFMDELVPHDKLGRNGYAFAINTNGYIIFHPELKNQLGWMRDPPNVDLTEIEFDSDEKTKIRSKIINCAASNGTEYGEDDVISLIKVSDEIHTYEKSRTYSYTGVPYSTFGITIVNSKYNKYYPVFSQDIKLIKLLECSHVHCSMVVSLPSDLNSQLQFTNDIFVYAELGLIGKCKIIKDNFSFSSTTTTTTTQQTSSTRQYSETKRRKIDKTAAQIVPLGSMDSSMANTISAIQSFNISTNPSVIRDKETNISNGDEVTKFSVELIKILNYLQNHSDDKCPHYESRRLITDLYVLEKVEKFLKRSDSLTSVIMSTLTGLSMVNPKSERHIYKDLFDNWLNSTMFQRTFDMEKFIFYTLFNIQDLQKEPDNSNNNSFPDLKVFKSFSVTMKPDHVIPIAVLGLSLKQLPLVSIMQKYEACNKTRLCYLIEDGGYVISVNDKKLLHQVGSFFGQISPLVMDILINNSIFKSIEDFDYQAICPKEKDEEISSSSSRLKPLTTLLSIPVVICKKILFYLENIFLFIRLLIQLALIHFSSAQEATATDNKNISCIKKYHRFYFNESSLNSLPTEITQTCKNCTFSIYVTRMNTSNLIIVSYDETQCSNNCNYNTQPNRYPIKDPGPDICKLSNEPRYRLRPKYKCYGFNPDENFMKCNSHKLDYFISTTRLFTFILATTCLLIINNLHL